MTKSRSAAVWSWLKRIFREARPWNVEGLQVMVVVFVLTIVVVPVLAFFVAVVT